MTVAIIRREKSGNSVAKAIDLCEGLGSIKNSDKVLIKPNCVWGADHKNVPPFGIVTTAKIIEELAQVLHDKGCRDITIGEGSSLQKELGANTTKAFEFSGMNRVAKEYNLKLIDFEGDSYEKVELDGHPFRIAKQAIETDFLINVPVLKTHGQTIVSLGMKNLKGCLKFSSKMRFHKTGNLEKMIALLNGYINTQLTIIDGIYDMQWGPNTGPAKRKDLIIAGTDILETEMVGAAVLGKNPSEIHHIKEFAKLTKRNLDLNSIVIKGEKIEDVSEDLPCGFDFDRDFKNFGLKGFRVVASEGDTTICTGCYVNMLFTHLMYAKDNPGLDGGNVEICIGRGAKASLSSEKVFLLGDCAIEANQDLENSIKVTGCPPDIGKYMPMFINNTLKKSRAKKLMLSRMIKTIGFKLGIYYEGFGLWEPYKSAEFDINHYR